MTIEQQVRQQLKEQGKQLRESQIWPLICNALLHDADERRKKARNQSSGAI